MTKHEWAWTIDPDLARELDLTRSRIVTWTKVIFCTRCAVCQRIDTVEEGGEELDERGLPPCVPSPGSWMTAVTLGSAFMLDNEAR